MNNDQNSIPSPSIRRFPSYLQVIKKLEEENRETVSATDIAEALSLNPVQVRKDIGYTGITGTPKIGYEIQELINVLMQALGWQNARHALLVGTGALGSALLGYRGFDEYGLHIIAAFDVNPELIGSTIHGKPVFGLEELPNWVKRSRVKIGVLTVPAEAAQSACDAMVDAGILGIWNFSPVKLNVPDHVVVQKEDLSSGLALLSVRLSKRLADGEIE
ncbi:MAG: redox-sensing transcriptional repressor Rex [Spirochaetales bacterium]|nr:redox-sensing transcriptional repressor Rex [Spirochaetales bacterium]MCF7939396.1 redox-sensing transcriptional repressor Rex [Spirochaetales bacterium]